MLDVVHRDGVGLHCVGAVDDGRGDGRDLGRHGGAGQRSLATA